MPWLCATAQPGLLSLAELAAGPLPAVLPEVGPDDPAYLNFTPSTTGAPKGAVTTLANLLANTVAANEAFDARSENPYLYPN